MANKPALKTSRVAFENKIYSAEDLFVAVREFAEGTWDSINGAEALFPGQARRVVSLAFLQIVISWEDFVEACFVRYLMGAESPSGYKPSLRLGEASSIHHAYQLASGNSRFKAGSDYISWAVWSDVEAKAHVFFEGGRPFSTISRLQRDRLSDAIKIRNRIAHASNKVKDDFKQVAKPHLGLATEDKLTQGFDVGSLLLAKNSKCFGKEVKKKSYFEHYADLSYEMANQICPVPSSESAQSRMP
ncbi:MAG: hypothetical protein IAE77_20975 [Prosthecobacter sp.]|jgi:hypothetical protein|uniref:hypothetical protein n=1 Tax=Prosthecobacter sp. TaxID=1965333 RepID=UPI0019E5B3F5|nr:hypothetical protein [Prosthecobacter sp.]MBE2285943.1 hypothetical protein [Prosthecobacter sp.]